LSYIYIVLTIILTVYGQIVLKWQVSNAGGLPVGQMDKARFIANLLLNLWVISAFLAAFLASISWMAAMTKFQLNYAYPFMSLNFVFVFALSAFIFNEPISLPRIIGLGLIVLGVIIGSLK